MVMAWWEIVVRYPYDLTADKDRIHNNTAANLTLGNGGEGGRGKRPLAAKARRQGE